MARSGNAIKAAKVSPAYLHSNSTSHTWPFSAIAELIDNAYDPDVGAKEIRIDHRIINEEDTLCFEDNGNGMDHETLFKMLSFGFSEKVQVGDVKPIGHYGNGFKSGSMRLGDDVLVFTRCTTSASVGMLSQTYLKAINAESVLVPIVTWDLPTDDFQNNKEDAMANLQAIVNHSIFKSKSDVLTALRSLEKMKTGTNIIIYNLKRNKENTQELDFTSDPDDIRNPETAVFDDTNINRPVNTLSHEYKRSLREYCSILYLKPRMTIVLRGKKVKTKFILKSLRRTETDVYKPRWLDQPLKLTFGFTTSKKREEYGLMLYNKNRLIRAYEKVGCQTKANEHGVGVVGVIEADFLEPIHNKQKFNRDEKYTAFMQRAASKLNDYYYEKTNTQDPDNVDDSMSEIPDWTWAQCDNCLQWRRLPLGYTDKLPENWYCRLNPDSAFNRCDIPEEPENEDEALQASYNKTYKKKQEEERRLQKGKEKVPPSEDKVDRKTSSDEDQDDYNQSLQKMLLDQQAKIHELEQEERRVKQRNADLLCSAGRLKLSEIISPKLMDKLQSSADTSSSAFTLGSPSISAPKRKNTIPEVIPDRIRKMMVEDTVAYGDFATTDSGLDDTLFFPSSAETDTSIKRGVSAMHLPQEGTSINYQTKVFEQTACQTDPTTFISPEEMQEIGQTKLNLLEAKDKLRDIRIKIWKMLKIIVPDFDYGMPEDIEGVISDFINVHEQGDPAELA